MSVHTRLFGRQAVPGPSHLSKHHAYVGQRIGAGADSARGFASTRCRGARSAGHYEVLKLPRNATKQQIKAKFYELSKKHHPDAGGNEARFHEIAEAYGTLGDDTKRRQYDTQFSSSSGSGGPGYPTAGYAGYTTARRTSSGPHRAWSPPGAHYTAPGSQGYQAFGKRTPPNFGGGGSGFSPYASAFRNAFDPASSSSSTGGGSARRDKSAWDKYAKERLKTRRDEELSSGSGFVRFVSVGLVLVLVLAFGGGVTARAEDGRGEGEGELKEEDEREERRAREEKWLREGVAVPLWGRRWDIRREEGPARAAGVAVEPRLDADWRGSVGGARDGGGALHLSEVESDR